MLNKQWGKEYRAHKKWVEQENRKARQQKQLIQWHKTEFVALLVAAKLAGVSHRRIEAWQTYTPAEAFKYRKWIAELAEDCVQFGHMDVPRSVVDVTFDEMQDAMEALYAMQLKDAVDASR